MSVLGPDALPAPLVATLAWQIGEIVREGEFRARLQEQGVSPSGSTPAEFAAVIHKDLERWPKFIRDLGIKVE